MLPDESLNEEKRAIARRHETAFERYLIDPEDRCVVSDFEVLLERGSGGSVDYGVAAALMSAASASPFRIHPPSEYVHFRIFASVLLPGSRCLYALANLCGEADGHPRLAFVMKDSRGRIRQLGCLEHNLVRYATERMGNKDRYLQSMFWRDSPFSSSEAVANVTLLWHLFLRTDEPMLRLVCGAFFRDTPFLLS